MGKISVFGFYGSHMLFTDFRLQEPKFTSVGLLRECVLDTALL
jgi:hypothetical protein